MQSSTRLESGALYKFTLHCLLDYGSRFGNKNGRGHARLDKFFDQSYRLLIDLWRDISPRQSWLQGILDGQDHHEDKTEIRQSRTGIVEQGTVHGGCPTCQGNGADCEAKAERLADEDDRTHHHGHFRKEEF
jgi:hypothetical protein